MKDNRPFYPHSFDEAQRTNNLEIYKQSYEANTDCKNTIQNAIANGYGNNRLNSDLAKPIIEEYGFDRVQYVLANTVQRKDWDGRISPANKEWAKETFVPEDKVGGTDRQGYLVIDSHTGLTDLFINQFKREYEALDLWDKSEMNSTKDLDFEGKVMVLDPAMLKDEYKTRDFQLFYCNSGFGCSPTARGRQISGKFLKDGENAQYRREDFVGEAKAELLPDFAKERLEEIKNPKPEKDKSQAKSQEKPSILAQLKANKEKIANAGKEKDVQDKGER